MVAEQAERWVPVPGWPGYEASDRGRVRSVPRRLPDGRWHGGTVLAQFPDSKGYLRVTLRNGARSSTKRVHVIVAETFHGRRPQGKQILHRDDDKTRNGAKDLRYGTPRENRWERTRRNRKEKRRNRGDSRGTYRVTSVAAPVAPPVTRGDVR